MPTVFTSKDFLLANQSDVWISTLTATSNVPTNRNATLSAAATINATTLSVTTLASKVYEGQRITYPGPVVVYVAADAAAGATSISTKPLSAALASGASGTYKNLTPIYSVNTATTSRDQESTSARNFRSGDWASNAVVMRSFSIACSGTVVVGDPAYSILSDASNGVGLASRLYVEVREPNGGGESGVAYVTGLERSRENDNFIQVSWTFLGDGPLTDIPADA